MKHLLLISLGPIQDFIASARRCQDLWFGSWLLSDLSREVAQEVRNLQGSTVVFPASHEDDSRAGVANLIFAELPEGADPGAVAKAARARQAARLTEISEAAWRNLHGDPLFHRGVAEAQRDELMEFLWVAVPYDRPFFEARRILYARMAAIKNTRLWTQPPWPQGTGVPKSSLDGQREAVIDEAAYDRKRGLSKERLRTRFGAKGAERLDGIALLKRLGVELDDGDPTYSRHRKPPFHSTCHLAMGAALEQIARRPDLSANYLDTLADLGLDLSRFRVRRDGGPPVLLGADGQGYDGSLLQESRVRDHFEENSEVYDLDDAVRRATGALRQLLRDSKVGLTPTPYYAFLLADGDRMGAAIDGLREMADQQQLGAALDGFAGACSDIVRRHRGTLIYAGGDDVLALLPLHRALAAARDLSDAFHTLVGPAAGGEAVSLSVGLAISHCQEPMSEAHALAKRAETLAKQSRNALAVLLSKRSGADRSVSGPWSAPFPLDARLATWVDWLGRGLVSSKTPFDLEQIADHFSPLTRAQQVERSAELQSLVRQVLSKKRQRGGGAPLDETVLSQFFETLGFGNPAAHAPADALRRFSQELQIAMTLLAAARDAGLAPLQSPRGDA